MNDLCLMRATTPRPGAPISVGPPPRQPQGPSLPATALAGQAIRAHPAEPGACGQALGVGGSARRAPREDRVDRPEDPLAAAVLPLVVAQSLEVGPLQRAEQRDELLGLEVVVVLDGS